MRATTEDSCAREVLVCLDKFRHSLSAAQACAALESGLRSEAPDQLVRSSPVADGGEGTAEVLVAAGYERLSLTVDGPHGEPVTAVLALRGGTAVVELAQAAGLHLSRGGATTASTYGVGQLVIAALDQGCRRIVLAVGGSATTDGGAGMLKALGARFSDGAGRDVGPGGSALARLDEIDLSQLDHRLGSTSLLLASDVVNPLLGSEGAAAVFGPQKGASAVDVTHMETGLRRLADLMEGVTGADLTARAGAGAAGGAGFAALALGAIHCSGVEFVLQEAGLASALPNARLVVVGEGSIDDQSLQGKAPVGIAAIAARHGVPVVAVGGQVLVEPATLRRVGISDAYAVLDLARDLQESLARASQFLDAIGRRIAREHLSGEPT